MIRVQNQHVLYLLTCAHVHICEVDLPARLASQFLNGIGLVGEIKASVAFVFHRRSRDPIVLVETRESALDLEPAGGAEAVVGHLVDFVFQLWTSPGPACVQEIEGHLGKKRGSCWQ